MFTAAAQRSCTGLGAVVTAADLAREGWSDDEVRAQLAARRWQRHGRAVVLHGGPPTPAERRRVVLLNCGRRALLTAFTAAEVHGLRGWERPTVHVLVPAGTRIRDVGESVRPHYAGDWAGVEAVPGRALHRCAPAFVLAASTFAHPRPACGSWRQASSSGSSRPGSCAPRSSGRRGRGTGGSSAPRSTTSGRAPTP